MSSNALQQTPRLAIQPKADSNCHNSHALHPLYRTKSPPVFARGSGYTYLVTLSRRGDALRQNCTQRPHPACAATRRSSQSHSYAHNRETKRIKIEQFLRQQHDGASLSPKFHASFLVALGASLLTLAAPSTAAELQQVSLLHSQHKHGQFNQTHCNAQ